MTDQTPAIEFLVATAEEKEIFGRECERLFPIFEGTRIVVFAEFMALMSAFYLRRFVRDGGDPIDALSGFYAACAEHALQYHLDGVIVAKGGSITVGDAEPH